MVDKDWARNGVWYYHQQYANTINFYFKTTPDFDITKFAFPEEFSHWKLVQWLARDANGMVGVSMHLDFHKYEPEDEAPKLLEFLAFYFSI